MTQSASAEAARLASVEATLHRLPDFAGHLRWLLVNKPRYRGVVGETHTRNGHQGRLLSIVDPDRLARILATMLAEDEFLSPYGLRALSRRHRDEPFTIELGGMTYTVDYQPGESTTGLFGGNSNWRGPVFGDTTLFQNDPSWHDLIPFPEYFHADTGLGLGASHQTGWTALVADLILHPTRISQG